MTHTGWLRLEGAMLALAAGVVFTLTGVSWWWMAVLILVPDVSMLGYLASPRLGALAYNAVHTTSGPLALGLVAHFVGSPSALAVAAIWLVHIGADRALGYGLKSPSGFQDTHLGRVGRAASR